MAAEIELEKMIVRLMGDAQSYMKMMNDAKLETAKAQSSIMNMGRSIEAVGAKIRNVGLGLSLAITTPILLLGRAAQSEFTEFEAALSRMEGLVGIASDEVARFRGEILKLAGPVGKSPVELAKAMEFITGSGIKGNAALETLTITAKAAAAGLGETVDVANAVTSAMNAYGPANLNAAKATDILVATVREGKAEASSFAPVFGQVLPLAAEMGISFGEVGGALAFLTRTTGNASIATTQLRSLMTQLLKPTEKSTKALKEMGISSDDVSNMIKKKGLITTLGFLKERLAAAGLEVKDMITDTEGLMGALQFTGPQAKIAAEMIKTVEAAANDTQRAFDAAAKTAKFSFAQAMAETKLAMIELGEIIAPVMKSLISWQRSAMEAWKGYSKEAKSALVVVIGVLAGLGPTVVILGTVISAVGKLTIAYGWMTASAVASKVSMTGLSGTLAFYTGAANIATIATLALNVAVGLGIVAIAAFIAYKVWHIITQAKEFNDEMQKSIDLTNQLNVMKDEKFNKKVEGFNAIKNPEDRAKALRAELDMARKEAQGAANAIGNAQKEVAAAKPNLGNRLLFGRNLEARKAAQQGLDEAAAASKSAEDKVKQLTKQLQDAEGEALKNTAKDAADKANGGKGNKAYVEGLQAELEMLQQESVLTKELGYTKELIPLINAGISETELKLARDTNIAIEAQKKQNDINQKSKDMLTSLKDDILGLGAGFEATAEEIELYKLTMQKADKATLQEAKGLVAQKKALDENKKLMEEGKSLKKQWLSPSAKLAEEQTKLSKMLELGAIDIGTYNKALKEAEKQAHKDYKVEFKTSGADAVAAGSAEAMERLREYQYAISGAGPLPLPGDAVSGKSKSLSYGETLQAQAPIEKPLSETKAENAKREEAQGKLFLATIAEGIKKLVTLTEQKNLGGEVVEFVTESLSGIRG